MLVVWPEERMRLKGGRSHWKEWEPLIDMEGSVVHQWTPFNADYNRRSHIDKTIILLQIDDKFVPIIESGAENIGDEV